MFGLFVYQVVWHTIMSGLFLQFMFGLFVLRWNKGFQAAEFLGNQTVVFLEYTIAGSSFVFGEEWYIHGFVMYVSILLKVLKVLFKKCFMHNLC